MRLISLFISSRLVAGFSAARKMDCMSRLYRSRFSSSAGDTAAAGGAGRELPLRKLGIQLLPPVLPVLTVLGWFLAWFWVWFFAGYPGDKKLGNQLLEDAGEGRKRGRLTALPPLLPPG